jgi:hypothetical protein
LIEPWPLKLFIPGHPRAYGSKVPNSWGHGVRDSSKYIAAWKKHVTEEMAAFEATWGPIGKAVLPIVRGQAVGVAFRFYIPTPKKVTTAYPISKAGDYSGDWDKMARAVGDCGTDAGLWWDDCQIVDGLVQQRWADAEHPAGVLVMFWPMEG